MIEVIKKEYWSKSAAFLLPLTGISRTDKFEIKTYVKWEHYSIEDYKLIVKISYSDQFEYQQYITENILKIKDVFAKEIYDFDGFSILIFDLSRWSTDVDMFLKGKYSKFSLNAKKAIEHYHIFGNNNISITIYACLYPKAKEKILDDMSALDYVISHYVLNDKPNKNDYETAEAWKKSGEICSVCNFQEETLILEQSQNDILETME